ncbi:hypothetical protein Cp1R7AA1_132 [Mesorhizobium phage Cp1R7A-A1]|nr:hypothetical protein Cp1R7AA1_132 [Mesorhizobium phage Cp1R7A-A1]
MLSVEVEFPTGKREVVAYVEGSEDYFSARPPHPEIRRIRPAPLIGWEFHQTMRGEWYAFAVPVDRDHWSRAG